MPIRLDAREQFYRVFRETQTVIDELIRSVLAPQGISVSEYELIRVIENTPNITAATAKKRLRITGSSVSAIITSLEKKKIIIRTADAKDARRLHIHLTKRGITLVTKVRNDFQTTLTAAGLNDSVFFSITHSLSFLLSSLSSHVS